MMVASPTRRSEFLAGFKDTIPLVVGAIPFGIIFGALTASGRLSAWGGLAMSAFVFAGSSQFIGAVLFNQGTSPLVIILTTFVVNLRHLLYSATLGPHMKHLSQKWLLPLGFWLTDETFVIVARRYQQPDVSPYKHWYYLGSAVFMYINWQLSTLVGIFAGQRIPDAENWGLDYAMIVTFIGMVVPFMKSRSGLVAVLVAGAVAVAVYGLPNKIGLMLAALAGVIAGVWSRSLFKEVAVAPTQQPTLIFGQSAQEQD